MTMLELRGGETSLVLEAVEGGAPLWRYWGPKWPVGAAAGLAPLAMGRSPASFSPDVDIALSLFPTFGLGWFGRSALLAHRGGRDFAQGFDHCVMEQVDEARLEVRLEDRVAGVAVTVRLALDASDALTVSTTLENTGDTPLQVDWLAAAVLPLPGEADRHRTFAGRHLDEFRPLATPLTRAGFHRETRRGLTSHDARPSGTVLTPGAGLHQGLCYGTEFAWSGNHVQSLDWVEDGRFQWQWGEWFAPGELRLQPGERYAAPEVVAGCSTSGLNGLARSFHAALRQRLDWPGGTMRPRPVSLNTWEAVYFDQDLEGLKALADAAAAIGVERFVLDDGWFRGRADDTSSLGDWTPDPGKYPEGLSPLIDHLRSRELEFGLWVEPEMVNADSDLLRAHPDWALEIDGRTRFTARNQLVLDLSRPEVVEHLFEALDKLLRAHPIAYLKWDHNRDLATAAGADGRAAYHRQVLGAYRLFERLRVAHPDVEIESCAGGGGRIDFGVLRHTHRVWTSDTIDARARLNIQRGFLLAYTPEIMGAHVGAEIAHTTGRRQSLDFRAAVALPGHFGLEIDLRHVEPAERERLALWIDLYKRLRDRLHGVAVTLGEGQDGLLWQAHGPDAQGGYVLLLYRLEPQSFRHAAPTPLPMLDAQTNYCVSRLDPASDSASRREHSSVHPGAALKSLGLATPRLNAETCAIFQLTREDG